MVNASMDIKSERAVAAVPVPLCKLSYIEKHHLHKNQLGGLRNYRNRMQLTRASFLSNTATSSGSGASH